MDKKILSVDIGTSSIKAGIVDRSGILVSWKRVAYNEVGGNLSNWFTGAWVLALKKAIIGMTHVDEINAVVFSGSGPTLIPFDSAGNYSAESLLWIDNKKIDIPGEESYFLPKALWFKKNRPEIYKKTALFVPLSGFFPYLLTQVPCAPLPHLSFSQYYWSDNSIEKAGLDKRKFPEFKCAGDLIGSVSETSAKEFGIKEGLPVFSGASDYLMALLGSGAVFPGSVCDRAGTSEGINYCSDKKIICENLRTLPHVIEKYYNISGVLASSGMIFEWFRKVSGQEEKSYIQLLKEISEVIHKEDSLYFFPSLKKGSVWQFSGGAFVGLEPGHGIPETGSAVVKSIGFSVRDVVQMMESCSIPIDEIRLSGGQSRNSLWNQMKADIIGKRIIVPEIFDGELVGCACAGFKGLGTFKSLIDASNSLVRIKDIYNPDFHTYDKYTVLFKKYSSMSRKITSMVGELVDN